MPIAVEYKARLVAEASVLRAFGHLPPESPEPTPGDLSEWIDSGRHLYKPEVWEAIKADDGVKPYQEYFK